jgi:biopolymer transport protein ExbD
VTFGGFERSQAPSQPMAEINVTPLVDVMLVLLVIFMIAAPLLAYALRLDLPDVKAPPVSTRVEAIRIAIDGQGRLFWNTDPIDAQELSVRLKAAGAKQPQPEVHLRADKAARFERVAEVMAAAQDAGLGKIGFVTEPRGDAVATKKDR